MRRPALALALVVAVLAITVGVAERVGSSAITPGGSSVTAAVAPVVGARLVCPDVASRKVGQIDRTTRLGVGTPATTPPGAPASGSIVVTRLAELGSATARPLLTLKARGAGATALGGPAGGDLVVDATGALAPGLSADVLDRRDGGPYRGLDGVACAAPSGEAWALGASTTVGQHTELRLTNTDDLPALVDIKLFGTKGPVNAKAGIGVGIGPRTTRTIHLETLAPDERLLLIQVQVRSGRVATSVRVQAQQAATPQGVDWLPLAAAPSTHTVVPGIGGGAGPRRLVLANPGNIDATASISVELGSGEFVPRGLSAVTVPAGALLAIDITKPLARAAGAVAVTADQPLVSAVSMSTGPRVNGYAEFAWTASAPKLTNPATVVVNFVHGRVSRLLLTAPETSGAVRITTLTGIGPSPTKSATVRIPAGRTIEVALTSFARFPDNLVGLTVAPVSGSGPVYAARVTAENGTRSGLLTVLPLVAAPEVRLVRPAVADLHAGLPN
jgi:hypothetical protein